MNIYQAVENAGMKITGVVAIPAKGEYFITNGNVVRRQGYKSINSCQPRILLEKIVDKKHPPEGYGLINIADQDRYLRPKGLMYWDVMLNRWCLVDDRAQMGQSLSPCDTYCMPLGSLLELKPIAVSMNQLINAYEASHDVRVKRPIEQ